MELEVEKYPGELKTLRARELKLAHICAAAEEFINTGEVCKSSSSGPLQSEASMDRLLSDPEIVRWLDQMRATGQVPLRRHPCQ